LAADRRGWAAIELSFSSAVTAFISEPKSVFSNHFDNSALKTKGRETSQWRAFDFLDPNQADGGPPRTGL
jgi:hypothetical protein